MAGAIEHALDAEENAAFWLRAAETMGASTTPPDRRDDTSLTGTLKDGLDPEENWDDVW